ncbi:hypothetical protein HPB47_001015, partial [Ixodes persulcatus]
MEVFFCLALPGWSDNPSRDRDVQLRLCRIPLGRALSSSWCWSRCPVGACRKKHTQVLRRANKGESDGAAVLPPAPRRRHPARCRRECHGHLSAYKSRIVLPSRLTDRAPNISSRFNGALLFPAIFRSLSEASHAGNFVRSAPVDAKAARNGSRGNLRKPQADENVASSLGALLFGSAREKTAGAARVAPDAKGPSQAPSSTSLLSFTLSGSSTSTFVLTARLPPRSSAPPDSRSTDRSAAAAVIAKMMPPWRNHPRGPCPWEAHRTGQAPGRLDPTGPVDQTLGAAAQGGVNTEGGRTAERANADLVPQRVRLRRGYLPGVGPPATLWPRGRRGRKEGRSISSPAGVGSTNPDQRLASPTTKSHSHSVATRSLRPHGSWERLIPAGSGRLHTDLLEAQPLPDNVAAAVQTLRASLPDLQAPAALASVQPARPPENPAAIEPATTTAPTTSAATTSSGPSLPASVVHQPPPTTPSSPRWNNSSAKTTLQGPPALLEGAQSDRAIDESSARIPRFPSTPPSCAVMGRYELGLTIAPNIRIKKREVCTVHPRALEEPRETVVNSAPTSGENAAGVAVASAAGSLVSTADGSTLAVLGQL